VKYIIIMIEQALIGVGNFLVSWLALRHLASDQVAAFAVLWSLAWAIFAVLSEALITPLRVGVSSSKDLTSLRSVKSLATYMAATLLLGSAVWHFFDSTDDSLAPLLMIAGIPCAAIAFYISRAIDVESKKPRNMLRRGLVYALCSATVLLIVSMAKPHRDLYLISACIALVVGSIDKEMQFAVSRSALSNSVKLVAKTMWDNRAFGIATALRVTLFSSGLMLLISLSEGSHAVAVYAAYFVLLSPIQLASSSLPWMLLSRQARLIGDRKAFSRELLLQLSVYVCLGLVACGVLSFVWDWWTTSSIADIEVRRAVQDSLLGVLSLMVFILLTSWSSTLTQVLKLRNAQLGAVVVGGLGGFCVVVGQGPIIVAALMPYLVSFAIATTFIVWRTNAIGR
jgi:hypothetical protein